VQWMGLICCRMAAKKIGMLGVSVRQIKALTVQIETMKLVGKGRLNLV
jgi:hypothetical protein